MFQLIWLLLSISQRLFPTPLVLLKHDLLSSFPYVNAYVHFYPYSTVLPCHPGSLADKGDAMLRLYLWSDLSSCVSLEVWYPSIISPVTYSWLGVLPPSCCTRDFVQSFTCSAQKCNTSGRKVLARAKAHAIIKFGASGKDKDCCIIAQKNNDLDQIGWGWLISTWQLKAECKSQWASIATRAESSISWTPRAYKAEVQAQSWFLWVPRL